MMGRTARIDISKEAAKGIEFGESVNLKLTGKIKGIETYEMDEVTASPSDKKSKKAEPRVTLTLSDYNVSIDGKSDAKKAYDKKYKEEMDDEEK